jgi:peptidoglycan-associated lipoprotein
VTASELLAAGFAADGRASVYFEFDQSVVRRADQPIVEGAAALMKAPNDLQLTIEGNTDDRGTSEYNIALGQRRAETVKRALVILGVDEGRIEATSNGEEKPRKRGSQESDHAENRRADLILR